jgi:hypothetical protein
LLPFLAAAGRYGRLLLVAGLLAGLFLPSAAAAVRPYVGELIAALLFLACLRIGPRQAVGVAADIGLGLKATLVLQLILPLALAALFRFAGWTGPTTLALTLMTAASPIAGSPNLLAMIGSDPAPALRQLVVGTALLPFTALAVFLFAPSLGAPGALFLAAARLLLVIGAAALIGFGIRLAILRDLSPGQREAIDGCSAIVMAVVVVGLMAAIGETWRENPQAVLVTGAVAFAANFGLQIATTLLVAKAGARHLAVALGVSAGNRNVALFLTALPAATTDVALLFIACYQVPMYLTPVILGRWYRSVTPEADG